MPKAKVVELAPRDWRNDPATDRQIMRLLVMLREDGIIDSEPGCPLEEHADEAAEWANQWLSIEIDRLQELTKGQIEMLFGKLE